MPAVIGRVPALSFRGLEQFSLVASTGGVNYCVAGAQPYALEFTNDLDVVCLLLGDINSRTKFEDDREQGLVFLGETSAFHPRGGNVRVAASDVRHGFVAFSYAPEFIDAVDDFRIERARRLGSRNNIEKGAIRHLAKYARSRIHTNGRLEPLEVQCLATLVLMETVRHLGALGEDRRSGLSESQFRRICDFIDGELENDVTCVKIATAVGLPLRVIFEGIKARTGFSPYRFVLERRIERAGELLVSSDLPISEIALACGFSSQQHLTSVLSKKTGQTPARLRRNH